MGKCGGGVEVRVEVWEVQGRCGEKYGDVRRCVGSVLELWER